MYQGGLRHLRTYSIALDYTGTKYTDNTFFSLFGSAPRLRLSFFFFSFFPYPFRAPPPTLLSSGLKVCLAVIDLGVTAFYMLRLVSSATALSQVRAVLCISLFSHCLLWNVVVVSYTLPFLHTSTFRFFVV